MTEFKLIPLFDIEFRNVLNDRDIEQIEESSPFVELMGSILQEGLLQPICVEAEQEDDGYRYKLLFGKRRYLAFLNLSKIHPKTFSEIPCMIVSSSDSKTPIEVKILHENKYRQDIPVDIFLESSLSLLPKFISSSNSISLEKGIEYLSEYYDIKENVSLSQNKDIVSFINSVEEFLEKVKIKLVEFNKYKILRDYPKEIQTLFYNGSINFSDTSHLSFMYEKDISNYESCLTDINKNGRNKEKNRLTIFSYLQGEKEDSINSLISFMNKKMKKIKSAMKTLTDISDSDSEKIESLIMELEKTIKNSKGTNEKK